MWEELERFRKVVTLSSGERVLLRPLSRNDSEALIELFRGASDDDVKYFRDNVRDEELVASWVENLDLRRVFPIVAVADDRIVGDATLHIGSGYSRHIGRIRLFLETSYRRKGIGTELIKVLVEIARRIGMQQVVAEVVGDQVHAIKAFESQGFKQEYRHEDYFLFGADETFDLLVFVRRLTPPPGKF